MRVKGKVSPDYLPVRAMSHEIQTMKTYKGDCKRAKKCEPSGGLTSD